MEDGMIGEALPPTASWDPRLYERASRAPLRLGETMTVGETSERASRRFPSGATRNSEEGKLDYEGFLSPLALECFAQYMHRHRHLEGGELRVSDNWQKGIPTTSYMKSLWRHLMEVWRCHRGLWKGEEDLTNALCGVMFNAMGYLHAVELMKRGALTEENKPGTL